MSSLCPLAYFGFWQSEWRHMFCWRRFPLFGAISMCQVIIGKTSFSADVWEALGIPVDRTEESGGLGKTERSMCSECRRDGVLLHLLWAHEGCRFRGSCFWSFGKRRARRSAVRMASRLGHRRNGGNWGHWTWKRTDLVRGRHQIVEVLPQGIVVSLTSLLALEGQEPMTVSPRMTELGSAGGRMFVCLPGWSDLSETHSPTRSSFRCAFHVFVNLRKI